MSDIKKWQERQPKPPEGKEWFPWMQIPYMQDEIDELSARVAELEAEQLETRRKHREDYDALHDAVAKVATLRAALEEQQGESNPRNPEFVAGFKAGNAAGRLRKAREAPPMTAADVLALIPKSYEPYEATVWVKPTDMRAGYYEKISRPFFCHVKFARAIEAHHKIEKPK